MDRACGPAAAAEKISLIVQLKSVRPCTLRSGTKIEGDDLDRYSRQAANVADVAAAPICFRRIAAARRHVVGRRVARRLDAAARKDARPCNYVGKRRRRRRARCGRRRRRRWRCGRRYRWHRHRGRRRRAGGRHRRGSEAYPPPGALLRLICVPEHGAVVRNDPVRSAAPAVVAARHSQVVSAHEPVHGLHVERDHLRRRRRQVAHEAVLVGAVVGRVAGRLDAVVRDDALAEDDGDGHRWRQRWVRWRR